ncbi:MAG: hypothetical protein GC136_03770 [Alphaproteobacteria bacterium]|nr:hypothetical protein [Alphaproteobacteria bacterium]
MIKTFVAFMTLAFIIAIIGGGIYFGTRTPAIEQTQKEVEIPYERLVSPPAAITAPAPAPASTTMPTEPANEQAPANND